MRSLQTHDRDVSEAADGGRVAACLVGVERGDIAARRRLVAGPPPPTSYRLDVELHPVPERSGGARGRPRRGAARHGGRRTPASCCCDDGALAQLRLEQPLATLRGDRVVLRTLARPTTVAGGVIADPRPARHAGGPEVDRRACARCWTAPTPTCWRRPSPSGRCARPTWSTAACSSPRRPQRAEAALVAAGSLVALGDGWLMTPADYRAAAASGPRGAGRPRRRRAALPRPARSRP